MIRLLIILFSFLIAGPSIFAYEIDNFTRRYESLSDSRDMLNDEVNKKLKEVQRRAVEADVGCNTDELESLVEGELTSGPLGLVGVIEEFAYTSPKIQRHKPVKEHIYSKRSLKEKGQGFVMTIFGKHSTLNVNGHYIGDDKLGHFFDQGFGYYLRTKEYQDLQEGISAAMEEGMESEKGLFGFETTGILSYADLAANYSGMQFWMNLHKGRNPYFKCIQKQWKQVRSFDFADYLDSSWDEGINCNKFKGSLARSVQEQVQTLDAKAQRNKKSHTFQCPISTSECVRLQEKYRKRKDQLLGPGCVDAQGRSDNRLHGQVPARSLGDSKYDQGSKDPKKPSKEKIKKGTR